jgi:cyclic di-GMP phosphodiesterase
VVRQRLPTSLAGGDIPLAGRIAAIADTFDALTRDRPYRHALSYEAATEVMVEERESHFDPALLDVFLESDALPRLFRRSA